jgi:hypothetical protein
VAGCKLELGRLDGAPHFFQQALGLALHVP